MTLHLNLKLIGSEHENSDIVSVYLNTATDLGLSLLLVLGVCIRLICVHFQNPNPIFWYWKHSVLSKKHSVLSNMWFLKSKFTTRSPWWSQWYLVSRDWNCDVSSLAVKCIAKDSKCSKDWPCAVSENGVTGTARRRTSMMLWNMKMARVVGTGLADPAMWVDIQTAPLLDSKLP